MIWWADPDCSKCHGNAQYEDSETLYTCDCGHEVVPERPLHGSVYLEREYVCLHCRATKQNAGSPCNSCERASILEEP